MNIIFTKQKWLATISALVITMMIGGCKKDTFIEKDALCPLVVSTVPLNNAVNVPLNQVVTATFNEEMDPKSITSATVIVSGSIVPGVVTYSGTTASFTPSNPLIVDHTYIGRITTAVRDLMGNTLQREYVWTFSTGTVLSPMVVTTDPANNDSNVVLNKVVTATFNMPMDPLTVTATTFTLKQGVNAIAGTISYAGSTASFTPTSLLLPGTVYTGTITTGAKSTTGLPLTTNYVWTFKTETFPAPLVISTDPANLATGVVINKVVTATFNTAMDPLTINGTSYTLKQGVNLIAGVVTYAGNTASFTPTAPLLTNTVYTATILNTVKNLAGTAMLVNYTWSFTTLNATVPTVILTDPLNAATNVPLTKIITATFSEPMDALTITGTTFLVKIGATAVTGVVTYTGSTATFTPSAKLLSGNTYTCTITTGAKNPSGTALAANYVWTFTTVDPLGPKAPTLNTVSRFGIISGVGVSNNAGASEIHDLDIGIYPGVRSSITGFFDVDGGPGLIFNGGFYAADDASPIPAMLLQAKADLTAAYLYAEGATSPAPTSVSGDQGGKTLAPGIYKSTSTLLIQNGNLTLDAQGDANAVWIFQIASAFTTVGASPYPSGAGGNVILSGGAQAKNVYWQVGSSATIGDYTSFKGNIMALTSITMNAYSQAVGRMLCSNGAVVLTSTNFIYKP